MKKRSYGGYSMDKKEVVSKFSAPTAEYRGKPFWSWNGELEEAELIRQVGVMKEMGLGGYFMHSRSGLITEYLGEEWFDLINAVADAGEKLGMESWLYDEDRWPSGSAGGKVTVDPQYRMKSIVLFEISPEAFRWGSDVYLAFAAVIDGCDVLEYFPITEAFDPETLPVGSPVRGQWKILKFSIVPDAPDSNYNGTTYIDTMSYRATARFIELTHEAYKKHCGDRLGRSIKGIFTDEPHRGRAMDNLQEKDGVRSCSMAWTDDLFEEFEKRYGYDAKAVLPELFYRPGGNKVAQVKLHYFDLANSLFIERFAIPINEWCIANGIEFTGHVLHEDSLTNQTVPNGSLMRFYEHMGYPGMDLLAEHNHCYWAAKQLSSAARQLGKKWMLSELYGCTGWQFDLKAHKAVGDWQALFGINLRCQHLSWYTMEGEAKRDYPASILHQSPYYKDYDYVETYFGRFGVVMSQGAAACDVLVINPIESIWCQAYLGWAQWINAVSEDAKALEAHYQRLFHMLTDHQIDFDYADEEMMSRMYAVEQDKAGNPIFRVGKSTYRTIVVSGALTIRPSTAEALYRFLEAGGSVIFAGEIPSYVNALPSDVPSKLASHRNAVVIPFEEDLLVEQVRMRSRYAVQIIYEDGVPAKDVFCQVRIDQETGLVYFVVLNTDRDGEKKGVQLRIPQPFGAVSLFGAAMEEWDLATGTRYHAGRLLSAEDHAVIITFDLLPAGEKVFVFDLRTEEQLPMLPERRILEKESLTGPFDYVLDEPNVCVLDFAKWRWNGGAWQPEAEVLKVDQAVRDLVGIERRGGGMLQPWYAKMNYKEIYGTVELELAFFADIIPEGPLFIAAERPENCEISLNGTILHCPDPHDFWIDICFKKLPVPQGLIRQGRNVVAVKTDFKRTTNIECLYLVGDFGVMTEGTRRTLTTLPKKIGNENIDQYHLPFYTGCISYVIPAARLAESTLREGERILLKVPSFCGSLVKASLTDGSNKIVMAWDPFEADVTDFVLAGKDVHLTLVCSRRNLFGPLHILPVRQGSYWPGSFVTSGPGWSDAYALLDSGIFEIERVKIVQA